MTAESIQNTNFGVRDFYVILSHLSIKNNDCRIHPKYEFRSQRFLCILSHLTIKNNDCRIHQKESLFIHNQTIQFNQTKFL